MESREFRPPLIKECPYNIECKVVRELDLGSHVMFIGEVVATPYTFSEISDRSKFLQPNGGWEVSAPAYMEEDDL